MLLLTPLLNKSEFARSNGHDLAAY